MTPIAPLAHPSFDLFLLGYITASSFVALLFFLRFWKSTSDPLFVAFAVFFATQAVTHTVVVGASHPNEASAWLYVLRLLSIIGILAAILWKNRRRT